MENKYLFKREKKSSKKNIVLIILIYIENVYNKWIPNYNSDIKCQEKSFLLILILFYLCNSSHES